jgi:hypothetical protein
MTLHDAWLMLPVDLRGQVYLLSACLLVAGYAVAVCRIGWPGGVKEIVRLSGIAVVGIAVGVAVAGLRRKRAQDGS